MSRKFKYEIGTRVTHERLGNGTIIDRCPNARYRPYLIEFDEKNSSLHDGDTVELKYREKKKVGKKNHCWWCCEDDVTPIKTEFDRNAFINDKIAVHLDTQEKYDAFMKECGKRGLNWSSGRRATDRKVFYVYTTETAVSYDHEEDGGLMYSPCEFYRSEGYSVCDYELPTESKPASWKVIIEGNGDVTTAKYIKGKNLVKNETVKRYYTDEYSVFKAIEALNNKMFGEEKTEKVKVEEPKFKPGDLVEIVENNMHIPAGLRGHIARECSGLSDCWLIDFHVNYGFTHNAGTIVKQFPEPTCYFVREKHFKKVN